MKMLTRAVMIAALIAVLAQTALAQTAEEIAEKYLTAIGGRVALGKIKSRHAIGRATFTTPDGEYSGTVEVFNQAPNKWRSLATVDLPGAGMGPITIDQRFDGISGYGMDSRWGIYEMTGNVLNNRANSSFPTPFLTLEERGATLEFARKEKVDGRDAYVVLLKPRFGSMMQCFIDAESFLLVKTIVALNVNVQQTVEFRDYRDVDGVKVPFQLKSTTGDQSETVNVTKVEHNTAFDDDMFSKPGTRHD